MTITPSREVETRKRVVAITHTVFHYRAPFHERVRHNLAADGIDYFVVYGQPDKAESKKGDTSSLSFGRLIRNRYLYCGRQPLIWQPALSYALNSDLLVIIHENRLLINYPLQILRRLLGLKVALFGHGRNFQSRNPNGKQERLKRWTALRADWWFGYTEETKRHIEGLGFPSDRITVFNNAVDTSAVREAAAAVTPARLAERRAELGIDKGPVGIFVGGLYEDKRLPYLIEAVDLIRLRIPNFQLIIIGGGVALPTLQQLVAHRPWIKVLGPRFGTDKVELMRLACVFLMPGLLGLAVLDAGAAELPTLTTDFPWHSPEIAYVEHGVNGLIVPGWQDPSAYAKAVAELLDDAPRLEKMTDEAAKLAARYTIEAMADRFSEGVRAALATPSR